MDSGAALRVRAESSGGAVEEGVTRVPARHLRVLPPPRAYAEPVGSRVHHRERGRSGAARQAVPAPLPPLRLTARGRRVIAVGALLLGLGVIALGGAVLGEEGGGLELMGTTKVIVEPGDTLWSIAGAAAGGRDVRDVIDDIRHLNELGSAAIAPGQVLLLP